MKKFLLPFFSLMITLSPLKAQLQRSAAGADDWQLGIGIGYTNYYGDLSNYRITRFSDLSKAWRFADYNRYYVPKPSFSVLLQKKINPTLGLILQFNQLEFSMSDRYRYKGGTLAYDAPNFARSLNFSTRVRDAGFALNFTTANGHALPVNAVFYPSFYLGAGIAQFDVKGDLYDDDNSPYNYMVQAQINDGHFETNLRDAKTETQTRYGNVVPYFDLGLALNFRISTNLGIALQSDIKYAGTDYLDDVSGRYKINYPSATAAYTAHPGYNFIDPVTRKRGDMTAMNDIYINSRLVLSFRLASFKKRVPSFRAPAVYSLAYQPVRPPADIKTTAVAGKTTADSLRRPVEDTAGVIWKDSITHAPVDTGYKRRVENKLDSLQGQLKKIKTVLRNQLYEQRYQHLQWQVDSVNRLKNAVLNRRLISNEDRLRGRIFNLQADSLQHALSLLQRRAETAMEDTDSSWMQQPAIPLKTVHVGANEFAENIDSSVEVNGNFYIPSDTITALTLTQWDAAMDTLRKQKRYGYDSSYRKTIDSLNNKLINYRAATQSAMAVQYLNDSLARLSQRTESIHLIDSLAGDVVDTAALQALKQNMERNKDSLGRLQTVLNQVRDSANYYQRLAFAAKSSADSINVQPKKWYQRLLPGTKRNINSSSEPAYTNEQEQYYDTRLEKLNQQVNDLQRNNTRLSNEYNRRQRSTDRVYRPTAPAYREPVRQNTADLGALRNEINALRSQLLLKPVLVTAAGKAVNSPRATDTIYVQVTPRADTVAVGTTPSQTLAMQQEIAQLKTALADLKKATAPVKKTVAKPGLKMLSVYFATGAADLLPAQIQKLADFKKTAGAGSYTLTGYTDAVGNAAANNALARKRMLFVRDLLVTQYDVPADSILLDEPVAGGERGAKPNALARKVTIRIE